MRIIGNIRTLSLSLLVCGLLLSSYGQESPGRAFLAVQSGNNSVAGAGHSGLSEHFSQNISEDFSEHFSDQFCGTDFSSPAARSAHKAYHQARRSGSLNRVAKYKSPPEIGDEVLFSIIENFGTADAGWVKKKFKLVDKETGTYYLWVDLDELADVPESKVTALRQALLETTPAESVDPGKGIIENTEFYFGAPPDYDQDGHTDILLYAIPGSTAGFVSSQDMDPLAPDSVGNQADVLYLDTILDTISLAAVVAHEYTHLLHFASGWDLNYTFVTEGYAEYAIVLNGYAFWRNIDYLNQMFEGQFEYTRPLFDWRFTPDNGGPKARDYQRGGLFFTYIADHYGPDIVGDMLRFEDKGPLGIDRILVLNNSSLVDVIQNFHTANFVNDRSLDPFFGYRQPRRTQLRASVTRTINGEELHDGPEGPEYATNVETEQLQGGAVTYIKWRDVANVKLKLDARGYQAFSDEDDRQTLKDFQQGNIRARVITVRPDGTTESRDIGASELTKRFNGKYESLTLQVSHSTVTSGRITYSAFWVPASTVTSTSDEPSVPTDVTLYQNYPNPFNPQTIIPFELSRGGMVRLSLYDVLGRQVAVLADRLFVAGRHELLLDAGRWPSGLYFYRLDAEGRAFTRSMRLVK